MESLEKDNTGARDHETAPVVSLGRRRIASLAPVLAAAATSSQFYSKRHLGNGRASRISAARRPAFKRPAAFIRPEFLKLLVAFEAGTVIFPPGPGTAPSSRESNWSVLLTLIAVPVVFLLLVTFVLDRVLVLTFVLVVLVVVDRVGDLTVVLVVAVVVARVVGGGRSSNVGGVAPR